jgi:hypothetical protein
MRAEAPMLNVPAVVNAKGPKGKIGQSPNWLTLKEGKHVSFARLVKWKASQRKTRRDCMDAKPVRNVLRVASSTHKCWRMQKHGQNQYWFVWSARKKKKL